MYYFDQKVDRTGFSSVKQCFTPECITDSGIMSMWGAEFEFPTAPFVIDAVVEWAKKGLYAYTIDDDNFHGLVQKWMKFHRNWNIKKEWIVPVYGITASLATAMRAFTSENDGIIGMVPGYHMYWKAVELSNRRKVPTNLIYDGKRYNINWEELETLMKDPENKILVLCNPHNPLGRVWNREELVRIGNMAYQNDVIIYSDEIFAECLYKDVEFYNISQVTDRVPKIITATSLGKWLSFTGTNQANLIISDEEVRNAFMGERDKEFYGSMNPMMLPAYKAAYTSEGEKWLSEMMEYVSGNYKLVHDFFSSKIPQFHAIKPEGTFILWVDATRMNMGEEELEKFMVQKAHFHMDVGTTYGSEPGFFRMNLSIPREELKKALESLANAENG